MAKAICFVEYRIRAADEAAYRSWIAAQKEEQQFQLFEGTDQLLLFVEVWEADSVAEGEHIKEERLNERSSWSFMEKWVDGGLSKIHAWTFKPF
ncbi:hypothetical protein [Paenibacillus sp. GCM10027626]|uniref:hypothetical protein n=1 Tax=Paenibacillus sp. GCM10027626 TaxID=3273411 RepID=UPI0036291719